MNTTESQFSEHVRRLVKNPERILAEITPGKMNLLHVSFGLGTEVGELQDAIKKHVINGKPLDRKNVVEEMGGVLFYYEAILQSVGVTMDEVRQFNMDQLAARYPQGYSDEAARARLDKQTTGETTTSGIA